MRVAQHAPTTWRGRTQSEARPPRDLNAHAVAIVRAVTDNLDGMWQRLRRTSAAVYTRVQKARSETQQPSALARVFEEILALHGAGVPKERLNIYVVETAAMVASLDGPSDGTAQAMLEAMQVANAAGAAEALAESQLALRADRTLGITDIQRLREKTRDAIAALQLQLLHLNHFEARQMAEHPMRVIRGGRA